MSGWDGDYFFFFLSDFRGKGQMGDERMGRGVFRRGVLGIICAWTWNTSIISNGA